MATSKEEILNKIAEAEQEKIDAKAAMAYHKKAAIDAESDVISANLKIERLKEELRVLINTTPFYEETYRDREIKELKDKLPELMKKINEK